MAQHGFPGGYLFYVEGAKVRNMGTYKEYDVQISTLFDEFHNILCVNSY